MQFEESNQVTYTTQFAMLQAISWEPDQTKHMFVRTLLCCYIPRLVLRWFSLIMQYFLRKFFDTL